MAKRSPIAGYNHNVRFRGLIFHVQTEDSGLASPHLFTHLFYGGVIISTRKLVYDAGSAEDAIKGLMQAQHKVVMKDLKRGAFDDKIDLYLAGNEELLPRAADSVGSDVAGKAAAAASAAARASVNLAVPDAVEPDGAVPEVLVSSDDTLAVPTELPREPSVRSQTDVDEIALLAAMDAAVEAEAAEPIPLPVKPRTQTADRKSAPTKVRTSLPSEPPPPAPSLEELEPPTLTDEAAASVAAALAVNATREDIAGFQLDDDEVIALEGGRIAQEASSAPSAPIPLTQRRVTGSGAAVPPLPPSLRPAVRAITGAPPNVRPPTRDDSADAITRFVPDPAPERAGQYAQHKRPSQHMNVVELAKAERELSGAIPSVLPPRTDSAPGSSASASQRMAAYRDSSAPATPRALTPSAPATLRALTPSVPATLRALTPSAPATPRALTPSVPVPPRVPTPSVPGSSGLPSVLRPRPPEVSALGARPAERPRTPTPTRVSGGSPPARPSQGGSGGVVMSRPAVIVGAPPRPLAPPRVRKAREDEGRGFGQGLISEKSLDEVILAYLSEDAEDK